MIRPLFTEFALFAAPFVVYAIFLIATKTSLIGWASWPPKTLATLAIMALVLMLGSFIYLAHFSGSPPGSTYVPAHIEDGRFVPGRTQ
jgi:heme/copper-type cytochrome/quinol oxidase subunit 3